MREEIRLRICRWCRQPLRGVLVVDGHVEREGERGHDSSCQEYDPVAVRISPAQGGIVAIEALAEPVFGCCDMHNRHCEPPGELCCSECTERAHDTFPVRHADGSACIMDG